VALIIVGVFLVMGALIGLLIRLAPSKTIPDPDSDPLKAEEQPLLA